MKLKDGQQIRYEISADSRTVTFYRRGGMRVFSIDKVHEDNQRRACAVGFAQVRITDAAAIGRADKDGRIIPEAERTEMKWARMMRLVEHYESGTAEWNLRSTPRAARLKGPSMEDIREALRQIGISEARIGGLDDERLKVLATGKTVAEKLLEIERERIVDSAGAEELLEELMGE